MTEITYDIRPQRRHRLVYLIIGLLLVTVFASVFPTAAGAAAPSIKAAPVKSLLLDGSMALPVSQVVSTVASADNGGLFASPVVLGAPSQTPLVLGDCVAFICLVDPTGSAKEIAQDVLNCALLPPIAVLLAALTGKKCPSPADVAKAALKLAMWPITERVKQEIQAFFLLYQRAAVTMTNWILTDELGGDNSFAAPVLSCKLATGAVAKNNCKDAWVINQLSIMRQIALFTLAPMFGLLVIQSLLKGSLFMLLRGAFIMLPVAILGSVIIVSLAQLLLNISDDFVNAIASYTGSTTEYANRVTAATQSLGMDTVNMFSALWCFLLLFAGFVIYIELLLRQLGVYLAAFFIPLGFAALVWPSTAGVFKAMLRLLIGLIFMKVFIAAGLAMGIEAFAFGSATTNGIPDQAGDATTAGVTALVTSALIICLSAFAATKLLAMTPAAIAGAEGRVLPTQNTLAKFQGIQVAMNRGSRLVNARSARKSGKTDGGMINRKKRTEFNSQK